MKTAERTAQQKKVFRAYDLHCDFCETCASYEQGHDTDLCYAGQVLWSCFYGRPYPARKNCIAHQVRDGERLCQCLPGFVCNNCLIFGDSSPAPTGVLKAPSGYRAAGKYVLQYSDEIGKTK